MRIAAAQIAHVIDAVSRDLADVGVDRSSHEFGCPVEDAAGVTVTIASSTSPPLTSLSVILLDGGGLFLAITGSDEPIAQGTWHDGDLTEVRTAIRLIVHFGIYWVGWPIRSWPTCVSLVIPSDVASAEAIQRRGYVRHDYLFEPAPSTS